MKTLIVVAHPNLKNSKVNKSWLKEAKKYPDKFTIHNLYEIYPNELKRSIGNISFKTLTSTLKELEKDDIIVRKEYPQIPPRVEYSLSKKGKSLIPILNMMCDWGEKNSI